MILDIEITEKELKKLVVDYINKMIDTPILEKDISIKVQSKQNYKVQEWEEGKFKAIYHYNGELK